MGEGCTRNRPPPRRACVPPRGRVEAHDGVARWTDFPPATQRRVLALMGSRGSTTCRCESQSICAASASDVKGMTLQLERPAHQLGILVAHGFYVAER